MGFKFLHQLQVLSSDPHGVKTIIPFDANLAETPREDGSAGA